MEVAGLRIEVHGVGEAESHADSYLVVHDGTRRVAFIGDLAFAGMHSYPADGHTGRWLAALDRLPGVLDGLALYPGHGALGDSSLLADQRRQLTALMGRFLPGAAVSWLVALGADAVAAELAADPVPA